MRAGERTVMGPKRNRKALTGETRWFTEPEWPQPTKVVPMGPYKRHVTTTHTEVMEWRLECGHWTRRVGTYERKVGTCQCRDCE